MEEGDKLFLAVLEASGRRSKKTLKKCMIILGILGYPEGSETRQDFLRWYYKIEQRQMVKSEEKGLRG